MPREELAVPPLGVRDTMRAAGMECYGRWWGLLLELRALDSPQGPAPRYGVMFEMLGGSLSSGPLWQWKRRLVAEEVLTKSFGFRLNGLV